MYGWTGHKAPPHEWVERSYIRDQMTYQVFNNVVVCVRTGPIWFLPPYIRMYTCGHHIRNVTDIFVTRDPLNIPKKCILQHPVT